MPVVAVNTKPTPVAGIVGVQALGLEFLTCVGVMIGHIRLFDVAQYANRVKR